MEGPLVTGLKPRERRVLLWGGLFAALILAYVYGVEPLLAAREETRRQLQSARQRVERYERLLTRQARLAEEAQAIEAKVAELRERMLPGPTPTLAAAQLQGAVKESARGAGLTVQRVSVERPLTVSKIAEVPVRMTMKGEIRQLSGFLRMIEGHHLLLSMPELAIQVQDPKDPRELIVDLTVSGYLLLPDGAPPLATEGRAK